MEGGKFVVKSLTLFLPLTTYGLLYVYHGCNVGMGVGVSKIPLCDPLLDGQRCIPWPWLGR